MKSAWRKFSFSIDDALGQRCGESLEHPVDLPGEREGVGARLLLDAQDDRRLAPGRRRCRAAGSGALANVRDVADA